MNTKVRLINVITIELNGEKMFLKPLIILHKILSNTIEYFVSNIHFEFSHEFSQISTHFSAL
jgi:hypothetical protein